MPEFRQRFGKRSGCRLRPILNKISPSLWPTSGMALSCTIWSWILSISLYTFCSEPIWSQISSAISKKTNSSDIKWKGFLPLLAAFVYLWPEVLYQFIPTFKLSFTTAHVWPLFQKLQQQNTSYGRRAGIDQKIFDAKEA